MHSTSELRIPLLFWKNELARKVNILSATLSRTIALWSLTQMCASSALGPASIWSSIATSVANESRRRRVAPRLYFDKLL